MKLSLSPLFNLSIYTLGFFCATNKITLAQVTSDGTVNTQVTQNGNVAEITGGETRGGNLFHSFQDFSVTTGNEAFFDNANSISNIFSRITGGNISNIDGAIRANGSANLFLINPAGIIFGENARLDIGGSFYGSSASSILFEDGEFSAVDNLEQPILTINAPIGLGFRDAPESITLQNSNLEISQGENISLIGGAISLNGSNVAASGGTVNLGATSSSGTIALDTNSNFDFGDISLGDISINDGSTVNVSGAGKGNVLVHANNLTLSEVSIFNAGINSNNLNTETLGGDIIVNASGTVALESGSLFRNNLNSNSLGNTGDISIEAQNLSLTGNSDLSSTTDGNGNAGNINLNIVDSVILDRTSGIKNQVLTNATGNGGNIQVNSDSIALSNNSLFIADVIGQGDGGNIQIDSNSISLNNSSLFIADIKGQGNGGDINVVTESLTLSEESSFSTSLSGQGNAGSINIQADDSVILESSRFSTLVAPEGIGNAGNININTNNLILRQGIVGSRSQLLTSTTGQGNAGNIIVNALTDISLEDSSFFLTQVGRTGEGNGGNIEISTTNLSLRGRAKDNQASLLAGSVGMGDAGDVLIDASSNVSLNQFSSINNQVSEGVGDAGDIIIDTDNLLVNGRSLIIGGTGDAITPSNNNVGDAGDIIINSPNIAVDNYSLIGNSSIFNAMGTPGKITIDTGNLTVVQGSLINSATENDSNGGEINVNARTIELNTGGKITTNTNGVGDAGNINLNVSEQINVDGANPFIPSEELRFKGETLRQLEPFTGLFASTLEESTGNGGNIQVVSPKIFTIINGGEVTVDSEGTGSGGNLLITANSLELSNQSQLVAETAFGQAEQVPSNIDLLIDDTLILRGDSLISAGALNNANGGNINIDAEFIVAFPAQAGGNDIVANAREGSGGNIRITTKGVFGIETNPQSSTSNDLDASSNVDGLDGNVSITTPDVNPLQGLRQLTTNTIEPGRNIIQTCAISKKEVRENRLSIISKGGIPNEPGLPLDSHNVLINGDSNSTSAFPEAVVTSKRKIQPARGIAVTESGEIILTAHHTDSLGARLPKGSANCGA